MELESAKNLMKERSVNLDKGLNNQATNPLEKDLRRIREMIPSNLPNFVNPAAIYLSLSIFCIMQPKEVISIKHAFPPATLGDRSKESIP